MGIAQLCCLQTASWLCVCKINQTILCREVIRTVSHYLRNPRVFQHNKNSPVITYIYCLDSNALLHLLLHTVLEFVLIACTNTYLGKLSLFDDLARNKLRKKYWKEYSLKYSFKSTVKKRPCRV